jgi:hypothetical protein
MSSATSAIFTRTAFGYSPERDRDDPLVTLIERAAREFYFAAAPGAWLVDSLPWSKHFIILRTLPILWPSSQTPTGLAAGYRL